MVAVCSFLLPFAVHGQAPQPPGGAVPGLPAGAQRPGLPPRDNAAQRPQNGTARIRGRVLAAPNNTPLRRAQLNIVATDNPQLRRATTTDADGRYEIAELPAGRYQVSATKAGYVQLQYGQRRAFEEGTPVSLADAQTLTNIDFALPKGGVINVRLSDEFGEPVAGISVQVERFQWGPNGQRRLISAGTGGILGLTGTDDRGEVRIFGLMPGEYVLEASNRLGGISPLSGGSSNAEGFSPTFYPGTLDSTQAQTISLGIGQEVSVQFPVIASRFSRIRGRAVDSRGQPAAGAGIQVVTQSGSGTGSSGAGQVNPDGTFAISGVAPGQHTLRFSTRAGADSVAAAIPVNVSGDIENLSVTLGPGASVTGRVIFDGTAPRTAPGGLANPRVSLQQGEPNAVLALLGNGSPGEIDADGNFKVTGATGRVFFAVTGLSPAWQIRSVTLDGDEIVETPIDFTGKTSVNDVRITLTDKLSNVNGRVTDAKGQNLAEYVVVIQPADQKEAIVAARLVKAVRPDTNGRFEVRALRPGRYLATAIESMEQNRHYSPEFQKELRRGAREFAIREGETMTLDLRLTPGI
jgi:protocatechuate 3,4-dioxygenase beta subunit